MPYIYLALTFLYGFLFGFWTLVILMKRSAMEEPIDPKEIVVVNNQTLPLGKVVVTSNLQSKLGEKMDSLLPKLISRHSSSDWGDVCPEDAKSNDHAAANGGRVLSCYKLDDVEIWAITEWDRSVTTFLLPEDY